MVRWLMGGSGREILSGWSGLCQGRSSVGRGPAGGRLCRRRAPRALPAFGTRDTDPATEDATRRGTGFPSGGRGAAPDGGRHGKAFTRAAQGPTMEP